MGRENRSAATISIDVDPLDAHLAGYGVAGLPPDHLVYERAIPRLLELLAERGVHATFFWVARDSGRNAQLLRKIASAGHEVASHTVSHPESWRLLGPDAIALELTRSRAELAEATARDIVGFRSPGWHSPAALGEQLRAAGYRYDASAFPSPALGAAGALLWARSRGRRRFALGVRQWFAAREPRAMRRVREIVEFPVSVTRTLRIPIYHTLRYSLSDRRFERALDRLALEGHALSYPLHAVDALGLGEDGADARLARHPGMQVPLSEKLALLRRTLEAIASRYRLETFQDRLNSLTTIESSSTQRRSAPTSSR